jgi:hypothetical protein
MTACQPPPTERRCRRVEIPLRIRRASLDYVCAAGLPREWKRRELMVFIKAKPNPVGAWSGSAKTTVEWATDSMTTAIRGRPGLEISYSSLALGTPIPVREWENRGRALTAISAMTIRGWFWKGRSRSPTVPASPD